MCAPTSKEVKEWPGFVVEVDFLMNFAVLCSIGG